MRFLFFAVLILFFTLLQSASVYIGGVKPDMALTAIVISAFFINGVWEGVVLVLLSVAAFGMELGFNITKLSQVVSEKELVSFFIAGLLSVFLVKYLPGKQLLNFLFLILITTTLSYVIVSPALIITFSFALELIYNLIFGSLLFYFLKWLKRSSF